MAECHPVAFQWVVEAKRRGATIIHIDPRFTRTSALATHHVPARAGGDIVLLGALINHVLSGGHEFREYVATYTNAADILPEGFTDTEDGGGLFSGYDPQTRRYDNTTWQPTGERDETLQHPRCVFQVLKRHSPGYLPTPRPEDASLDAYLTRLPDTGFWGLKRKYMTSLLKAWFGGAATADNDYCFGYLPRITGDHGTYATVLDMIEGKIKGYFLWGQNPAVGSA